MDDFFQNLKDLSDNEDQEEAIKTGRQKLREINEGLRLDFAWKLLSWVQQRHYSGRYSEEIINDVLELAEEASTEQAALLLVRKAYYAFRKFDTNEAASYANLALKKSRDIGSNKAESESLIIKAFLSEDKLEHKKASAWYTIALAKCTKLQRPGLLLKLGTFFKRQGEYSQAWSLINQAQSLASDLSNDQSLDDIERMRCKRTVSESYVQLSSIYSDLGDIWSAYHALSKGSWFKDEGVFENDNFEASEAEKSSILLSRVHKTHATKPWAWKTPYEGKGNYSIISHYKEYGRFRSLMNEKQYEDALRVSRKILFEGTIGSQNDFNQLNDFIENYTVIFLRILQAISVCLSATGRITDSETLNKEEALFCDLKQQTGFDNPNDRNYKLLIQKKRLGATLRRVLLKIPDLVEYKNIQAKYYKDKGRDRVIFKIGKKEIIKKSKRYFLVFKCLVDNAGEKVSEKDLDDFVLKQGEPINTKGESGLRVYVDRLKTQINLAQFLVPHEGKGWMLQAP